MSGFSEQIHGLGPVSVAQTIHGGSPILWAFGIVHIVFPQTFSGFVNSFFSWSSAESVLFIIFCWICLFVSFTLDKPSYSSGVFVLFHVWWTSLFGHYSLKGPGHSHVYGLTGCLLQALQPDSHVSSGC